MLTNKNKLKRKPNGKAWSKVGVSVISDNPETEITDNEVVPDKLLKHCKGIVVRIRKLSFRESKSNEKEMTEALSMDEKNTDNQEKLETVAEIVQSVKEDDAKKYNKRSTRAKIYTKVTSKKTFSGRKIKTSKLLNRFFLVMLIRRHIKIMRDREHHCTSYFKKVMIY